MQTTNEKIGFVLEEINSHPMTNYLKIVENSCLLYCVNGSVIAGAYHSDEQLYLLSLEKILKELDRVWVDGPLEYRFSEKYQWLSEKISIFYKVKRDELSTEDFNLLSHYEKKLIQLEEFVNGIN